ncbi:family 10 glycosylhydrolase [Brachybacterium timonense]|uniref:family 10 glycosylhydrolase n=1 Tax=Brachybacterium timonense TaxID=2050896 RepID=UPI001FEB744C|nr:family 10 glycosylhydrolase [Brachybacterium timonense]
MCTRTHQHSVCQLRGMWIATVLGIDWPTAGAPVEQQKQEYLALLDAAVDMKLNAIVSQVRPTADVFWPSPYEPWSLYIIGEQGRDPEVPQV